MRIALFLPRVRIIYDEEQGFRRDDVTQERMH